MTKDIVSVRLILLSHSGDGHILWEDSSMLACRHGISKYRSDPIFSIPNVEVFSPLPYQLTNMAGPIDATLTITENGKVLFERVVTDDDMHDVNIAVGDGVFVPAR